MLSNPAIPASVRTRQYRLEYPGILPPIRPPPFSFILLPGGRYILGFAVTADVVATYVLCWDITTVSRSGDEDDGDGMSILQPVAQLELNGMLPFNVHREWVQVQSESQTGAVVIGMRLVLEEDTLLFRT